MKVAIEKFQKDILDLYDSIEQFSSENHSAEECVESFLELDDLRRQFNETFDLLKKVTMVSMSNVTEIRLKGMLVEKKRKSSKKEWNHTGLSQLVLDRLKMTSLNDDGEFALTLEEAVARMFTFAHVDYWRVKELAKFDVNPDRFCKVEEGDETITIRKDI